MLELESMFTRYKKYILYLLSLYVLGWGFTPYQSVFLGLIFGTSVSLYNLWVMVRKTRRLGEATQSGKKFATLGTFTRFASAALVVLVAYEYSEYIDLISAVLGLMTFYIVIMIDSIFIIVFKRHE
jgi:ATP synthase protein I